MPSKHRLVAPLARLIVVGVIAFFAWQNYAHWYERALVAVLFTGLPQFESPQTTISGTVKRRTGEIVVRYLADPEGNRIEAAGLKFREFDYTIVVFMALVAAFPGWAAFRRPLLLLASALLLFSGHLLQLYLNIQWVYVSGNVPRVEWGFHASRAIRWLFHFNREIGSIALPLLSWGVLIVAHCRRPSPRPTPSPVSSRSNEASSKAREPGEVVREGATLQVHMEDRS